MLKTLILAIAVLLPALATGCSLLQSTGQNTGRILKRIVSSGSRRESTLDRIEKEEPEYLLDSVFRKDRENNPDDTGPQDHEQARKIYNEAEQLYRQGVDLRTKSADADDKEYVEVFVKAARKYLHAAELWTGSTLEQDALFKAGEAYFFADYFKKANDTYEKLIKFYAGTRYADVVHARRFAIAQYWLDLARRKPQNPVLVNFTDEERPMRDTAGAALRILNRIRLDHATGKIADDATLALANAYFERKRFMDAADTYEDLRVNFPNSEHQFHAHLFELRSRLEAYQGPHYDGTHLETAEKLLKAILTQFPQQAEAQRELLVKENARIRKMKAERQMALATYYENRGAYQAAKLHYHQIQAEFPNTPVAEDAEQRLARIQDKPARSNEPPAWIAKLFPEPKPAEPLFGTSLKSQIR